ncbi:hypothetical protein H0W80_02410 [Candidatus Saccharibacteria bacterium]|nr:hypothetical protein [Candidatus Saccharibacteria bacterium]
MKNTQRKVTYRTDAKIAPAKQSGYTKKQKAKLRYQQRAQKIALTQSKRYLIYALGCFLIAQTIKFVFYSIIFRGEATPGGIWFLFVIYLQTGLLLMTFIFFILAIFKTLVRLLTEEV